MTEQITDQRVENQDPIPTQSEEEIILQEKLDEKIKHSTVSSPKNQRKNILTCFTHIGLFHIFFKLWIY
jgi:hypothetical protein